MQRSSAIGSRSEKDRLIEYDKFVRSIQMAARCIVFWTFFVIVQAATATIVFSLVFFTGKKEICGAIVVMDILFILATI